MNQAQELILEFEKIGGSVSLIENNGLRIEAPQGALTDDMKSALAVHKQDILQTLRSIQAANHPYINERGVLIIPFDSDPRFHWWANNGQTILETLQELKASPEIIAQHAPGGSA
jgi:hypothetical protein